MFRAWLAMLAAMFAAAGAFAAGEAPENLAAALRALGHGEAALAALRQDEACSGAAGVRHLRLVQVVSGMRVHGAYARAAFDRSGRLVHLIDRLAELPSQASVEPARIAPAEALRRAVARLHPAAPQRFDPVMVQGATTRFDGGEFFEDLPAVTSVAVPVGGRLAQAWLVETWTRAGNDLHETLVSGDGRVLEVQRRTATENHLLPGSDEFGAAAPATAANRAVAATSLLHLNRAIDVLVRRYGGDDSPPGLGRVPEAGAAEGGPVRIETQARGGLHDANFAAPAGARRPRLQVALWAEGSSHELAVSSATGGAYFDAVPAPSGAQPDAAGIQGALVLAQPADGCGELQAAALAGRIAVVERGGCSFASKASHAQAAGAIALVVASDGPAAEMGGIDPGSAMPAFMISRADARRLKALAAHAELRALLREKAAAPGQMEGAVDPDVVFHAYGHGLTWKLIGSMSGPLAAAVGEGAADGLAMLATGDDAIGERSAGRGEGLRRHRYAGYPLAYGAVTGRSAHDDGEVYGAIVWRMMELFGSEGRSRLFGYFVDGMNYTPAAPAFEDMREGLLAAVAAQAVPGDRCRVWRAFAQFGVGEGAQARVRADGTLRVTESFALPAGCEGDERNAGRASDRAAPEPPASTPRRWPALAQAWMAAG